LPGLDQELVPGLGRTGNSGMLEQVPDLDLQAVREHHVVGVQEGDEIAARRSDSRIAGGGYSPVLEQPKFRTQRIAPRRRWWRPSTRR